MHIRNSLEYCDIVKEVFSSFTYLYIATTDGGGGDQM